MNTVRYGLIGGTGVYDPQILSDVQEMAVKTPYGDVKVTLGLYEGREVVFLPRHGSGHTIPPHKINYRANIWALKELGVQRVLATAAVGSLNADMKPGGMVLVDQFLDFTKGRESTFFDGGDMGVVHTDFTEPYCPTTREVLRQAAGELGFSYHDRGVYVCTEGPRFETAAEIRAFRVLGGDLVGMTSVPEVVLAHEIGLCYACIAMVTNYAAGISQAKLTHAEVVEVMQSNTARLRSLAMRTLALLPEERTCQCRTEDQGGSIVG